MEACRAAHDAGARWVVLCDTNGGTLPEEIARIVSEVIAAIYATDLTVGVVSCSSGVTFNLRTKMGQAALQQRGRGVLDAPGFVLTKFQNLA